MLRIVFFMSRCFKNESFHDDDLSVTENVQRILLITECVMFNILDSRWTGNTFEVVLQILTLRLSSNKNDPNDNYKEKVIKDIVWYLGYHEDTTKHVGIVNWLIFFKFKKYYNYRDRRTQWLRCCATNRKVAGSIPAGVSGYFID